MGPRRASQVSVSRARALPRAPAERGRIAEELARRRGEPVHVAGRHDASGAERQPARRGRRRRRRRPARRRRARAGARRSGRAPAGRERARPCLARGAVDLAPRQVAEPPFGAIAAARARPAPPGRRRRAVGRRRPPDDLDGVVEPLVRADDAEESSVWPSSVARPAGRPIGCGITRASTPSSATVSRPRRLCTTTRSKRASSRSQSSRFARRRRGSRSWAVKTEGARSRSRCRRPPGPRATGREPTSGRRRPSRQQADRVLGTLSGSADASGEEARARGVRRARRAGSRPGAGASAEAKPRRYELPHPRPAASAERARGRSRACTPGGRRGRRAP